MIKKRMYVLVRRDLDQTYRCVQGAHALAQLNKEYPSQVKEWNNETIVFLNAGNLMGLREWIDKLKKRKKVFSVFFEPDLDDQETALACFDSGVIFKKLNLA